MRSYLYDKHFLKELDNMQMRKVYARIIALSMDDLPQGQVEGRITSGSINIDGNSAVRRTCSLNFVTTTQLDEIIVNKYWSYNHKFKLEIGLANNTNSSIYTDEIIWFDQGVYIITSFSVAQNVTGLSVSIQGKDKMCRLNGEVSGSIPMEVDFGTEEIIHNKEDGSIDYITVQKLPLKTIIFNAVREYGQERLENIIINDLEDDAFELWEYRGADPLYILLNNDKRVKTFFFDGTITVQVNENGTTKDYELKDVPEKYLYFVNAINPDEQQDIEPIRLGTKQYYLSKFEYGDAIGYHTTQLVHNTDLILKAGEPLTALFDKIKNMLVNYEYFYDLQGRFVFQRKKDYAQELFSPIDGKYKTPSLNTTPYSYRFDNYDLLTNISAPPQIENIKNDFTVWGSRKSVSGVELPIHARYSIHTKPTEYKTYQGRVYSSNIYDWRELIYQMAVDYFNHKNKADYLQTIQNYNSWIKNNKTGYEHYYIDMMGFWRQLYNPSPTEQDIQSYGEFYIDGINKYWNKNVILDPSHLNFWIDFLDLEGSEYDNYSINKIGLRSKVLQDNSLKTICNIDTPEILFVLLPEEQDLNLENIQGSKSIMQIQENYRTLFAQSSQGQSIVDKINTLFEEHTISSSNISLTSAPIYYLQPNTRIYVQGHGDYAISTISYSLGHTATMNISGTKISPLITTL